MEFFVILTAWLLLQWLGPSTPLHRDQWLHHWYLRAGDALGALPVVARLLLIALLPALLVCLLVRPLSALARFQVLAGELGHFDARLRALLPSATEEARLLGRQRELQQLLQRLESGPAG